MLPEYHMSVVENNVPRIPALIMNRRFGAYFPYGKPTYIIHWSNPHAPWFMADA